MPLVLPFGVAILVGCFGILPVPIAAGLTAFAVGVAAARRVRRTFLVAVVAVGVLTGTVRASIAPPPVFDPVVAGSGPRTIVGVVDDVPDRRDGIQRVRLSLRSVDDGLAPGRIQADLPREPRLKYGDVVRFIGAITEPPVFDDFDYRGYLARQGVTALSRSDAVDRVGGDEVDPVLGAVHGLRDRLATALAASLPEPAASLATGLLVGGRSGLSPDLSRAFARTGTSHLLAVSGYNMQLVGAFLLSVLLIGIGRRPAVIVSLGGVAAYTLLAGASMSSLRAAAMFAAGTAGLLLGRQRSGALVLVLAAATLAMIDPWAVLDVGFQLSVLATAGLVVLAPRFMTQFDRIPLLARATLVRDSLATTLAAVIATAPLTVATFQSFSLVAVPVNLLAALLVAPAMFASLAVAVAGSVAVDLGRLIAPIAWLPLSLLAAIVELGGRLPFASVRIGDLPDAVVPMSYLGIAAVVAFRRFLFRWRPLVMGVPALGLAVPLLISRPGPDLTIRYLDVAGDASVVRTAAGTTILVNGGSADRDLLAALGPAIPIWNRRIDLIVVTSWRLADALPEVARRHDIGLVIAPAGGGRTSTALSDLGVAVRTIEEPTRVVVGDVTLRYWPGDRLILDRGSFHAGWIDGTAASTRLNVARVLPGGSAQADLVVVPARSTDSVPSGVLRTDRDGTVQLRVQATRIEVTAARR